MSFICIIIKNHFHINGFALSLALKVRFFGTRKWPIVLSSSYPGDLPQQNLKPKRLEFAELYRLRYCFQEESESVSRVKCRWIWGIWPLPYKFGDFLNRSIRGQFVSLQKRAHWKTSPVKSGVPIRLCEQKRSFKDYRRFRSLMNFIAVNYSHTFKKQCRNNRSRLPLFEVLECLCQCFKFMHREAFFFLVH